MDLFEICKKISNGDKKINIKSLNVFYEYKKDKNEKTKREQRLIFITSESMENKLKVSNVDNYFEEITYRIVTKLQLGYKLLTITRADYMPLILIRYED